jgi:1-acyl-sn-glycerol-3-phosphate acyltransferase
MRSVLPAVPVLGPSVPRRGNAFSRWLGRVGMALCRFRFEGSFPDIPRFVLIVAPHTSNWDFVVGLFAKLALGLRARFIAKHTLFRGPFGAFLRWMGGMPVDRRAPGGIVESAIEAMRSREKLCLVITPEGTRKKVAAWKAGFYRVAHGAGVPILPVAFDYRKRAIVFEPLFQPSGDYDADLPKLLAGFDASMAYRPENY